MRNDIFEMRRDPKQKDAADKLIEGRRSKVKANLESNQWYSMAIEILGERMRVSLDGNANHDSALRTESQDYNV